METIAKKYATWSAALGFLVAATPWLALGWGNLAEFQYLRAIVIGCLAALAVARAIAASAVGDDWSFGVGQSAFDLP